MPTRELDWAAASVTGGKLTVPLTGEPDATWKARCEATLEQLRRAGGSGADAGDVEVKKDRVVVAHVAEGREDDVRFLLESIVLQANGDDDDDGEGGPEDEAAAADERIASAFQAFADAAEGSS